MNSSKASGTIRLTNHEDGQHEVPAEVLARALTGMQQVIYLTATVQEKKRFEQRFYVSQEIRQKYAINCQLPKAGSYIVPFSLGVTGTQLSAFASGETILKMIEDIFSSIKDEEIDRVIDYIKDEKLRNRVLMEVRRFLPKVGEGWQFAFRRTDHSEILLTAETAIPLIDRALSQDAPEDTVMTITGELIRIDFDKRAIVLRYPPTRQEIECLYVDELEETMLDNRRELIQATGKFTLDTAGNPINLTDVMRLELVDLSPLNLKIIQWEDRQFEFSKPLVLKPTLDNESQQLYIVEHKDLGLYVFAQNREQLIQEIAEQIAFMWDAYVTVPEEKLAPDALQLRDHLKQYIHTT